jgi:putative transposase
VFVLYAIVTYVLACLVDLLTAKWMSEDEKDIEIALLRQQLRIVERRQERGPHIPRCQKVPLAVLTDRLKERSQQAKEKLEATILLFRPATVMKWHRAAVRRKWTYQQKRKPGRPRIDPELEYWIVRLAKENPGLGYDKLEGELAKLGFTVSPNTVKNVMIRNGLPPAPERDKLGTSWRDFLTHYKDQILACDFFAVETVGLKTLYVLFFIEIGSRRVHLAGCTQHPKTAWVEQQARKMLWKVDEDALSTRYLLHDNDQKFTDGFDTLFGSQGSEVKQLPYRAPNTNAYAERWVRTVREECLDKLLIWNEAHLRRVLLEYVHYYNSRRPHQGLEQDSPEGLKLLSEEGEIQCRDVLGGIIHDYYRRAA